MPRHHPHAPGLLATAPSGPGWWRSITLGPRPGAIPLQDVSLFLWATRAPGYYTLELGSTSGLPFSARVQYSAYQTTGARRVEVATSVRIPLICRSVAIFATNLSGTPNDVVASIAPGYAQGNPQRAFTSTVGIAAPFPIPIPPFGAWCRMEVGGALATGTLDTVDGLGNILGSYTLGTQPPGGIPTAALDHVLVTTSGPARVSFWENR